MDFVAQALNLDAAESVFFARELEHVKAKVFEIQYPELKAEQFVPVSYEAGPGAETITYTEYDEVGQAQLIASYADDLPTVDVKGNQYSSTVKGIGIGYVYSNQEARAAAQGKKPLAQWKANAARKAHARLRDELMAFGDSKANLKGFTNHPNVPVIAVTTGGGGNTWALKTADEMLADLYLMVSTPLTTTKGIEFVNQIILPLSSYVQAMNKKFSPEGKTVMQQFKETHPDVAVDHWYKLETAGAGSVKRAIAYHKSPEKLQAEVPLEFTQNAPQPKNLAVQVPCESRFGGVTWYVPLSAVYMDGM
jgi:hypothetical protein